MDIEQMKKDLGGGNVFPIGEENVVFAKYFTGECYLNMLTTCLLYTSPSPRD